MSHPHERAIPVRPFGENGKPYSSHEHKITDSFDFLAPGHGEHEGVHNHHPGNLLIKLYFWIYMLFCIFDYITSYKSVIN